MSEMLVVPHILSNRQEASFPDIIGIETDVTYMIFPAIRGSKEREQRNTTIIAEFIVAKDKSVDCTTRGDN
jgi:hypothetical protein